jgi:hypothetical protein
VKLTITTPAIYEKKQVYTINDIDPITSKSTQSTVTSDASGRLIIVLNGGAHHIGINKKTDKPNVGMATFQITNMDWATNRQAIKLSVRLLNKGMSVARNVTANLTATRKNTEVIQHQTQFGNIAPNESANGKTEFMFHVKGDSIDMVQFRLDIKDDGRNKWSQVFELPIKKYVEEITNFEIADGKIFTVARSGVETEAVKLGNGNGDGIANPGESIVLLVKDAGKLWRTDLSFSNKYLNPFGINKRKSDNWTNFDHVGASAKYDVPLIAGNCPQNESLKFFAEYWLPEYPFHIIRQGVIKIKVQGKDVTAPIIDSIYTDGNNTVTVKAYDGSPISSLHVKLVHTKDASKVIELELKDDGRNGDRAAEDHLFSVIVPEQKFGFYHATAIAKDTHGNESWKETARELILH